MTSAIENEDTIELQSLIRARGELLHDIQKTELTEGAIKILQKVQPEEKKHQQLFNKFKKQYLNQMSKNIKSRKATQAYSAQKKRA